MGLRWYHYINQGVRATSRDKIIDVIVRKIEGTREKPEVSLEIVENGEQVACLNFSEERGLVEIRGGLLVGISSGRELRPGKINLHYQTSRDYNLTPMKYRPRS